MSDSSNHSHRMRAVYGGDDGKYVLSRLLASGRIISPMTEADIPVHNMVVGMLGEMGIGEEDLPDIVEFVLSLPVREEKE